VVLIVQCFSSFQGGLPRYFVVCNGALRFNPFLCSRTTVKGTKNIEQREGCRPRSHHCRSSDASRGRVRPLAMSQGREPDGTSGPAFDRLVVSTPHTKRPSQ